MTKLTAIEFKALKDDAARYSAYDNAASAEEEARRAQGDALDDHQKALDNAAQVKIDNDAATKKLNDDHATTLQEIVAKAKAETDAAQQGFEDILAAQKSANEQVLADAQAKAAADLAAKDVELAKLTATNADLTATIQKVFPTVEAGKAELAKMRKAELAAAIVAKDVEKQKLMDELDKIDNPIIPEVPIEGVAVVPKDKKAKSVKKEKRKGK